MTKEQAIKYLTNKKVFVKNKSSEIQEKLFSLGIYWSGNSATVQYKYAPFLYFRMGDDILRISHGSNVDIFYAHEYDEITVEDILNINIEPEYRPFKDSKECWDEMLKHQPFGWLKNKVTNVMSLINEVSPLGNTVSLGVSDMPIYSMYSMFTFADGVPFGIKDN